jgi:acetyl-CoA carboxylase biotin carboxyl carrier protein
MARTNKPKAGGAKVTTSGTTLDLEALRQIVEILEASEVTRLVWTNGTEKVSIRRGAPPVTHLVQHLGGAMPSTPGVVVSSTPPSAAPPGVAPAARASAPSRAAPAPAPEAERKGQVISSPFVGTFYRSPAPDQPSFAEVGSMVKKGQVLCIVEAMKLMNEIESDVAGRVTEVLAQNGQPVEYGQPLFRVEPA